MGEVKRRLYSMHILISFWSILGGSKSLVAITVGPTRKYLKSLVGHLFPGVSPGFSFKGKTVLNKRFKSQNNLGRLHRRRGPPPPPADPAGEVKRTRFLSTCFLASPMRKERA